MPSQQHVSLFPPPSISLNVFQQMLMQSFSPCLLHTHLFVLVLLIIVPTLFLKQVAINPVINSIALRQCKGNV